ncbi:MAG: SDR family oxidoreductase [Dehalococcoidales bacterium]|nr:SDR family oxidoreductase [Dehalococcoidales bacterium]
MAGVLKDKVAIVTGAGRGLGKAFALKYAEEGAKLFLPDISLERAQKTAEEIRAKGGEAYAMKVDISSEKETQDMAAEVVKRYGRADILLNNAAIWYGIDITPWDAWKVEDWDRIFRVNVTGMWLCCKAIAPIMIKQGKGKIINIASNVARSPAAQFFLPYACSKGAVYTLTQALARALGGSGINVNAIAPGYTATEASLNQKDSAKIFEIATGEQTMHQKLQPEDMVGAAVFLASSASDLITGQTYYIDGGTVML